MGAYAGTLRRLLPAIAVAAVIGLSLLAPSAALGQGDLVGYGYGNNCGVKGSGFHDHGKPCPNRPFPGHGKGVLALLQRAVPKENGGDTDAAEGTTTKAHGKSQVKTVAVAAETGATNAATATASTSATQTALKGHKGHGKAKGHQADDGGAGVM